jgi:menaquinone-dependent protoporphyrinogen oxidase
MRVLVSVASKHGATAEIADRIGEVLTGAGIDTDVRPPDVVLGVAQYDAVILGSGVYAGHWLGAARQLVEREEVALQARPVWLFSSGPIGDPAKPPTDPVDVEAVQKRIGAIDHHLFAGKLDRKDLGYAERAIMKVVHAAEGDFRPWDDIATWASGIARTLWAQPAGGAR